jgi:predicted transposase YbfD/YdcC
MLLEAQLFFEEQLPRSLLRASSRNRHGSREELRQLRVGPALIACRDWPTPVRFVEVTSTVREKGATRTELRLFLTNLPPEEATPQRLLRLVRGHWGIENRLHYVRDFTFDEDRCPIRTRNGPRVAATSRSLVIALLRAARFKNIAAALRTLAYRPRQAIRLVTTPPPPKRMK